MTSEEKLLTEKAASKNLTIDQLLTICELADDLEFHTDGAVQPLNLRRMPGGGSELRLFTWCGWYQVQIHAGQLQCTYARWGGPSVDLHQSEESVAAWEVLRTKILLMEGYECELQKNFDTCQKLKPTSSLKV